MNVYLKSPGVSDVVQKLKGITTFLHRSGHRLTNLKDIQNRLDLEETRQPKTGNSVRWSYTSQSQEWFRKSQPALLMYDVTHRHEEEHNDGAYSDNKLHHNELNLNTQSVCVTHPAAEAVRCLEGTKCVTFPLVLPAIYKLLCNLENSYLRQHWDDITVPVASIGQNVKEARKKHLADVTRRWVTELSTDTKRLLLIATLFDPRYKHYAFRSEGKRQWAEAALRNEWQHWKGAQNQSRNVLNQGNQPKRPRDFPDDSDDDEEQSPATTDELDLYLSLSQERKDICVLASWRNFRLSAPRLAEMARQLLATPASSASCRTIVRRSRSYLR